MNLLLTLALPLYVRNSIVNSSYTHVNIRSNTCVSDSKVSTRKLNTDAVGVYVQVKRLSNHQNGCTGKFMFAKPEK